SMSSVISYKASALLSANAGVAATPRAAIKGKAACRDDVFIARTVRASGRPYDSTDRARAKPHGNPGAQRRATPARRIRLLQLPQQRAADRIPRPKGAEQAVVAGLHVLVVLPERDDGAGRRRIAEA